jgi:MFS family permease
MQISKGGLAWTLALLFAINFLNFYDRQVLGAVGEPIRIEWGLNDAQLASLTTAFVLLYALVGLPLGHWADTGPRKVILSVGVIVWTLFTGLSGLATTFAWLFVFRLGVGVGEASCAPAANSLLGDLFPPQQRARALSVFMLGLPLGLGASLLVSGIIAEHSGWRAAFYVAAAPGLFLGLLALWLPDPARGAAEPYRSAVGREAILRVIAGVLRIPTMWWIIASGAILNLNLYALGSFLTSHLVRYHGLNIDHANRFSSVIYGFGGGLGLVLGGWLADLTVGKRTSGRLELAALAMLLSAPCMWFALEQPPREPWRFAALLLPGCMLLYVYYSTVYAAIQDVVEPARRGTAMAIYFFVFYLFTALGLYGFGWLSDWLAHEAVAGGATPVAARAIGLRGAFYVVPILTVVLAFVLWAGSRTVTRDHARLMERMRREDEPAALART